MKKFQPTLYVLTALIGALIGIYISKKESIEKVFYSNNKVDELMNLVHTSYVDSMSMEEIIEQTMPKILTELDPHSTYIPAKDLEATNADLKGSEYNDPFVFEDGKIITKTNHNGGINGGITNGMPIIFRCAVKPTPSIFKEQNTVDFKNFENAKLNINGRHDPAIVHRARAVVDCITAITLADMLVGRFGTDWLSTPKV